MEPAAWKTLLDASADPARARHHFELLAGSAGESLDRLPQESRGILVAVLAGSQALPRLLIRRPDWLELFADPEALAQPRRKQGLEREVEEWLAPGPARGDARDPLDALHDFRLKEQLRIGARDLAGLASLPDTVLELSNAADVFLDGILRAVLPRHLERFGRPFHLDADNEWRPTAFCVLGLGKLGGQELNYSSDVDLLFVYSDEGSTFRAKPRRRSSTGQVQANYQFFKGLSEAFVKEAAGRGVDAGGVRIDMRLRPEGERGPLSRSLDSYENYYAEWGQTWERMMLLKARPVAGDATLGGEFLEVVQPFRYPRAIGDGLLGEMAEMKARTEREVVRAGELDRNLKLGRGGIREIEFVAQTLQVLHGGRMPFLQTPHTLEALPKLAAHGLLPSEAVSSLAAAYPFLRETEHLLQMEEMQQTHTLPAEPAAALRIARLAGFTSVRAFQATLRNHTENVRRVYDSVLGGGHAEGDSLPADFTTEVEAWRELLARHGFREPHRGIQMIREFVEGPGFVHVSRRTRELGRELIPRLLELCPGSRPARGADANRFVLSDPDRVLARLDTYVQAYGTRASLYELWSARPAVFEHIVKLFDRSEFLAELAIRAPDIVDGLESGGHLRRSKDAVQTLTELRHGAGDPDQGVWIRRYFQTEFMRLGLRDILGIVDYAAANAELSALAEACLQYACEVIARRHRLKSVPFAVIGLGKLGGRELVYGSDLDVIFVAPAGTRNLPRLQSLAGELIELLSARTEEGTVFVLDARLRPDGVKGLLVNTLAAHEEYYRQRAMLWEIQALTRARAVAGHPATGVGFEKLAARLVDFSSPPLPLAAFTPEWKTEIAKMRTRIERERTPVGADALAFKTGAGGLVDAEFLAQAMSMQHGWFEPNTARSLEHARESGVLTAKDAKGLMEGLRELRRMESVLRRWSFEGEAVLPQDAAALKRVAVRCGYGDSDSFLAAVARWRTAIRRSYDKHLGPPRAAK